MSFSPFVVKPMLRRTLCWLQGLPRHPIPDDTKAFHSWFSGMVVRQEKIVPGGYPAIRVFPVYGKRWVTGRTLVMFFAGMAIYGAWTYPEMARFHYELWVEGLERNVQHIAYSQAELNLRTLIAAYKRHRFEQEQIFPRGHPGLTTEFRKIFYHDDVWRPAFSDVLLHPIFKIGHHTMTYNWSFAYW